MEKLKLKATAIGSLPHTDPSEALDLVFDIFKDIAMWPQLPTLVPQEGMTLQYSQNLAGLVFEDGKCFLNSESDDFFEKVEELFIDYESILASDDVFDCAQILDKYAITKPYSHTFEPFLKRLGESQYGFAKGHITGAFTYASGICDQSGKSVYYDETLREVVVKTLALKAVWQIKEFKRASKSITPIIFMDEPSLSQLGSCAFLTVQSSEILAVINEVANLINKFGGISAIHSCGKADWNLIAQSDVQMINFDAYFYSQNLATCAENIGKFLDKGGYLAWGVVPTLDKEALIKADVQFLLNKFNEGLSCLTKKGLCEARIVERSLITPSCGAGSLDKELATKAMAMTQKLADELKGAGA